MTPSFPPRRSSDLPHLGGELADQTRDRRIGIGARRIDQRGQQRMARQITFRPRAFEAEFRSEEHTSELQSLMRISYAVFCLQKNTNELCQRYTRNDYATLSLRHTTTIN